MMKKFDRSMIFYCVGIIVVISQQTMQSSDVYTIDTPITNYYHKDRFSFDQRINLIDAHINKAPCFNTQLAARIMSGKSKAECFNILTFAQKIAESKNSRAIRMHDFYDASLNDNILPYTDLDEHGTYVYTPAQKFITAIHEVGHAMAIALLNQNEFPYRVYYVTIDPKQLMKNMKGGKTSAAQLHEKVNTHDYHHPLILVNLASGVAEQMFNIHKVDKGFSDPGVVTFSEYDVKAAHPAFMELMSTSRLSDDIQDAIRHSCLILDPTGQLYATYQQFGQSALNEEIKSRIYQYLFVGYIQAHKLLHPHKNVIEKASRRLIENDTMTGEEFYELVGVRQPLFDFESTDSIL